MKILDDKGLAYLWEKIKDKLYDLQYEINDLWYAVNDKDIDGGGA